MPSIFSRIIAGEIPCHKIAENEHFFAFLDINPLAAGHTLVVPKNETDYLFDMPDTELGNMMVFAKGVAKAIEKAIPCLRIGVTVIGLEVPHAHIHLIPMTSHGTDDLNFTKTRASFTPDQYTQIATLIKQHYNA
jgi:histidine triad (HIT) family protein